MKTLLFPTDFSNNAFNAIVYALDLYKNEACKFIILNAFEANGYVEGSRFIAQPNAVTLHKARQTSERGLSKLKEQLEQIKTNIDHQFLTVSSNHFLIDAINEQLRLNSIELIVIGTQGSTGAYKIVYGSNTIEIMEKVKNCPILAIPGEERFTGLNEIVLANGFYLKNEERDFDYLITMAKKHEAPLRILTISETGGLTEEQEKNKNILSGYFEKSPHSFHMLEHVNVPIGIYCFSESRNSSLISFVNKKYNFIEKLLFNPLYKNLGNYSKTPVLVLHRTSEI